MDEENHGANHCATGCNIFVSKMAVKNGEKFVHQLLGILNAILVEACCSVQTDFLFSCYTNFYGISALFC